EMGRKMGEIILRNRMSKEELLKSHTSEGMRLAIAYAVQLRPEQGDLAILHQLAVEAEQLYTRYSILIGYDTLVRNSMISREQLQETLQRVKSFRHKADPS